MGMAFRPDPKPAARVVDKDATHRARFRRGNDECACCGQPRTNHHHVIGKGAPHHGDDVPENLLPVCGSGSSGCHGAFHGNPYTDARGRRWTPEEVRLRLGHAIRCRPEMIRYVLTKLGLEAGSDYLRRRYLLEVEA